MTVSDFCKMVLENSNSGQWLNCTAPVQYNDKTFNVGIKAFGLWVQRLWQKCFRKTHESELEVSFMPQVLRVSGSPRQSDFSLAQRGAVLI
jgi:hypothetical protein